MNTFDLKVLQEIHEKETIITVLQQCNGLTVMIHQYGSVCQGTDAGKVKKYRYIGDRMTDPALKGQICQAIVRPNGKCIRGKNGSMLVSFQGVPIVVIGRLLRKYPTP